MVWIKRVYRVSLGAMRLTGIYEDAKGLDATMFWRFVLFLRKISGEPWARVLENAILPIATLPYRNSVWCAKVLFRRMHCASPEEEDEGH